jgi:hypothetical protein
MKLTLLFPMLLVSFCSLHKEQRTFKAGLDDTWVVSWKTTKCLKYGFKVLSNTMSDTCKLGILEIPPKMTGILIASECHDGLN